MQRSRGFTLIELVLVVFLIGLISSFAVTRLGSITLWQQKGDVRKFANTWRFLFQEAIQRGEAYRLIIDLDANEYFVRREIHTPQTTIREVDYLENLRTKSEQERRKQESRRDLRSLQEEYKEEDKKQSGALDTLFYELVYADPSDSFSLGQPLEFPELAEPKKLAHGLAFRDARTSEGIVSEGEVFIRFSPHGGSNFAAVHLTLDEHVFTVFMNPASGGVQLINQDIDFEWTYGQSSS